MHQQDSNRLTTKEVGTDFAAALSDLLKPAFVGILSNSTNEKIYIIYIPEEFLDQASQDLPRLDENRRGMHWGVPSHNRAWKDYCTFMLVNEKILGQKDHLPRCQKGIWWYKSLRFLDWHWLGHSVAGLRRTASGSGLREFNSSLWHH